MRSIVFRKHPPPPEVQSGDQARIFVVRAPEALGAIKYWLITRKYNQFIESRDSLGNTLLGLIWDYDLGIMPSQRRKERGLIAVWDPDLVVPAKKIILHYLTIENPYAHWWHDMKLFGLKNVDNLENQ